MLHSALLPAASKIQIQTIVRFSIAGSIEAGDLEVIASRKLQRVLHSYKHEAFQKVKYKLDLRTFPPIVSAHPYCARLRVQIHMPRPPRHVLSAHATGHGNLSSCGSKARETMVSKCELIL